MDMRKVNNHYTNHKLPFPGYQTVLKWIRQYQTNGFTGCENRDQWSKYTCNFGHLNLDEGEPFITQKWPVTHGKTLENKLLS